MVQLYLPRIRTRSKYFGYFKSAAADRDIVIKAIPKRSIYFIMTKEEK